MKKSPDVVTLRIDQRVAELEVLAASTAVAWGRSPQRSFREIAGEGQDKTEKFLERIRRPMPSAPAPDEPTR